MSYLPMTYEFPTWVVFRLSNTGSSPSLVSGVTSRRSDSCRDTLPRRAAPLLLVSVAFLALASTAAASRSPTRARNTPPSPPRGQNPAVSRLKPGAVSRDKRELTAGFGLATRTRPVRRRIRQLYFYTLDITEFRVFVDETTTRKQCVEQFAARGSDRCAEQPPDRLADLSGELLWKSRPSPHAPARSRSRADLCRLPGGLVLGDAVSAAASAKRGFVKNPCTEALTSVP